MYLFTYLKGTTHIPEHINVNLPELAQKLLYICVPCRSKKQFELQNICCCCWKQVGVMDPSDRGSGRVL